MKCLRKLNKRKEDGQSMLEFVLVLPVFMLLLFMIIDYGWLFYNMNSVENAARNAARVACVEYTQCVYTVDGGGNKVLSTTADYNLADVIADADNNGSTYTLQEKNIIKQVGYALPEHQSTTSVKITFTGGAQVDDRIEGDVVVAVTYKIAGFTPLLGAGQGSTSRDFTATSTFKVEKNG